MRDKILLAIRHPLITGSAIMVFGSLAGNVFNFFYRIMMIKSLSVADYGALASLISLFTLPSLAALAIVPTIVQFAGEYFAQGKLDLVKGLFIKMYTFFFAISILSLLVFVVFSSVISQFLHIQNALFVVLSGVIVFFGLLNAVNNAFLQAKLAFRYIVFVAIAGAILKLVFGAGFVYLGYTVGGALVAYLFSFIIPYIMTFLPMRFVFQKHSKSIHIGTWALFHYGVPSSLAMLALTALINADIILVKHFFSPTDAGIYAGASLIGQIIFFLSGPINSVMFPLIVQRHAKKENYNHLFYLSLFFVIVPSVVITLFYFLFPGFIMTIFFKETKHLPSMTLLGTFGIFATIYAIIAVLTNFYLSIKKTFVFIPLLAASILQIILIWFFHASFFQVVYDSIIVCSLLLVVLLLYYGKLQRSTIRT